MAEEREERKSLYDLPIEDKLQYLYGILGGRGIDVHLRVEGPYWTFVSVTRLDEQEEQPKVRENLDNEKDVKPESVACYVYKPLHGEYVM